MPIIRLAGSGGGGIEAAGQASAAFQQASQPGVNAYQRALEVNGQSQVQAAEIALRQQYNDALFQDREQRASAQRAAADRQSATMYSGAGTAAGKRVGMVPAPFTGHGVFDLYNELAELDPAAADEMFAEMATAFEGYGPLSPEALESDPRFPSIYSGASQRVIRARTQRREQAIMGSFEGSVRTLRQDFGDSLLPEELAEFEEELATVLADDIPADDAAKLANVIRRKAGAVASRNTWADSLVQEAKDLLVTMPKSSFESYDGGKTAWDRAFDLIGDIRMAEDPDDVMAQIRLLVDPKMGAIKRRVEADTTRNVMAQRALADLQFEERLRNEQKGFQRKEPPTPNEQAFGVKSTAEQAAGKGGTPPTTGAPQTDSPSLSPSTVKASEARGIEKMFAGAMPQGARHMKGVFDKMGVPLDADRATKRQALLDWAQTRLPMDLEDPKVLRSLADQYKDGIDVSTPDRAALAAIIGFFTQEAGLAE